MTVSEFIKFFPCHDTYTAYTFTRIEEMATQVVEKYGYEGLIIIFRNKNVPGEVKNSMLIAHQYAIRLDNTKNFRTLYQAFLRR